MPQQAGARPHGISRSCLRRPGREVRGEPAAGVQQSGGPGRRCGVGKRADLNSLTGPGDFWVEDAGWRGQEWCSRPRLGVLGEETQGEQPPGQDQGLPAAVCARRLPKVSVKQLKIIWRTICVSDHSDLFWARQKPRGSEVIRRVCRGQNGVSRGSQEAGKLSERVPNAAAFLAPVSLGLDLVLRAWGLGAVHCSTSLMQRFALKNAEGSLQSGGIRGLLARPAPWGSGSAAPLAACFPKDVAPRSAPQGSDLENKRLPGVTQ